MKYSALIALILLSLFIDAGAQDARTVSQKLDAFFAPPGATDFFNGNVLVSENGRKIYQRSFGYSDFANKTLNSDNSTFQTASISKVFTSTAILQLKDKGLLRLSDPVVKYLPGLPYPNITVRHLLSHTSGLPDLELYQKLVDQNSALVISGSDVLPALKQWSKPLKFQPGEKAEYCNTNYVLLAILVEKITGMPYADYLAGHIFRPAHMDNSFVRVAGKGSSREPLVKNQILSTMYKTVPEDVATLDLKDPVKIRRIRYENYNLGATVGDQNVISTTNDLLKFDEALYSGKLLSEATMNEAFTPVKLNSGEVYLGEAETAYASRCSFGLGWIICDDPKIGKLVSHDGYNRGISTMFYRNITKRQTVIMFDNAEGGSFNEKVASVVSILNGNAPVVIDTKRSATREFGELLVNRGIESALIRLNELRGDSNYVLSERGLNILGYDLLFNGYKAESLEAFKLNVILFPGSSNVYDSYAEALAENGRKAQAIAMYKKAIALDPKNEERVRSLQKLQEENKAGEK